MGETKKINIAKTLLTAIGAAGVLRVALIAPNALQMFDLFKERKYGASKAKYSAKRSLARLKERGLVEFVSKSGKTYLKLTEGGEQELLKYQLGEIKLEKHKWDGKWRMIIFDINEKYKKIREALRRELAGLGFLRLQDSVWVYPYECEELAILLKTYFKTGASVLYVVAESIENDKWLKKEFNLS